MARATHSDGTEVVVKVFAKHDPLLQLDSYKNTLMEIYGKLYTMANVLPFQHFWVRYALVIEACYPMMYTLYRSVSLLFILAAFLAPNRQAWKLYSNSPNVDANETLQTCPD